MIPPDKLEQIRAASDIVDVIGGYVPLKRAGANFVTLCPFHKEKSPSFNVNPHKQIFHCFGCHKGGDVFTFVKEFENIPFMDAVRRLAERAKIPLEFENNPGQQQTRHLKDALLTIHEQITQRWQAALANDAAGQIARDYLAKRGVSEEAIKLFRLGYAPDKWDDTVNWAKSKGHELAVVAQGGLILQKEGSDSYYDRFRGRLMFPICDEQGRVIGFSGRILAGDEKTAKYVNSPETPIFTKGKVIFGLDKSKRALLDREYAIICEGQLDLIACFMAGVENVIAPQGTALTADHTRILKRYVDEVVLCFDADNAGQNAAVRSLDILLGSGLAIRVATMPAPHDPDSFIKEFGPDAFRERIEGAEGFFDYYLNRLCTTNDITTDKGRTTVVRDMAEAVQKTGDAMLIGTYSRKTAARLGLSPDTTHNQFKKAPKTRPAPATAAEPVEPPMESVTMERPSADEFWLLKLVLKHDELIELLAQHLQLEWIAHAGLRQLLTMRLAAFADQNWTGPATLLGELEDEHLKSLATEAMSETRELPDPPRQLLDLLTKLRKVVIDRQLAVLTQQFHQPGLPEEERNEIIRQQQTLIMLKRQKLG